MIVLQCQNQLGYFQDSMNLEQFANSIDVISMVVSLTCVVCNMTENRIKRTAFEVDYHQANNLC